MEPFLDGGKSRPLVAFALSIGDGMMTKYFIEMHYGVSNSFFTLLSVLKTVTFGTVFVFA